MLYKEPVVNLSTYEKGLRPYAASAANARGRLYGEAESPSRSPFQRDRDRIIHCSTFRRLKHKTQVFVFHEGDYYRTRLTHSIEVSQIARSVCRALDLNEDLAEALSLAHDFGHTAFGHAGEEALDAAMKPYGGFDHNAQSLRLVTTLEHRYAAFPGLNLTWDTLEGLAKHNGPLAKAPIDAKNPPKTLPYAMREYLALHDLEVHTWPSAEAQVSAQPGFVPAGAVKFVAHPVRRTRPRGPGLVEVVAPRSAPRKQKNACGGGE